MGSVVQVPEPILPPSFPKGLDPERSTHRPTHFPDLRCKGRRGRAISLPVRHDLLHSLPPFLEGPTDPSVVLGPLPAPPDPRWVLLPSRLGTQDPKSIPSRTAPAELLRLLAPTRRVPTPKDVSSSEGPGPSSLGASNNPSLVSPRSPKTRETREGVGVGGGGREGMRWGVVRCATFGRPKTRQ